MRDSSWDSLGARIRPTETLKTIDNPRVIARALSLVMWAGVIQILISGALFAIFDEPEVAWAAIGLAAAYLSAWIVLAVTGSVFGMVLIAFLAGTIANVYAHVALGGYANSGAILLYGISFVSVLALLVDRRIAVIGGVITGTAGLILGLFEGPLRASRPAPDPALSTLLFLVVLVGSINLVPPLIGYFMGRLRYERERAERLLLNVLPRTVATELKENGTTTARRFADVSVLFADIVGFTPMSANMEAEEVVTRLNEVFTHFDGLADRYQVEKIRTIGDTYMVAAGVPVPRADHAHALASMALDMMAYAVQGPLSFRIGIHSGPAVAGVIGTRKFQYDIWGDTVNTASRMESHGEPGRIQISDATYQLIKDRFAISPRGSIEVKGKGTLTTWWLEGERHMAADLSG